MKSLSQVIISLLIITQLMLSIGYFNGSPSILNLSDVIKNASHKIFINESLTADEIENIIQNIDERTSWIFSEVRLRPVNSEHLSVFIRKENDGFIDFYDNGTLVYRFFTYDYDKVMFAEYYLCYDENGNLIYGSIVRFRGAAYSMYFYQESLLHVEVGPLRTGGLYINGGLAHVIDIVKADESYSFVLDDMSRILRISVIPR